MYRIGFLAVLFIVFVVADASSSLSKHRILIGEPQNDNTTVPGKGKEGSPVPSPLLPPTVSSSGENGSDTKPVDDPSKEKVESSQPAKIPKPKVDEGPKVGLNNDTKRGEGKDVETEMKDPEPAKTSNDDPKPDTDKVKDNPKEDTDKVLKDNPKEKGNEKDNPKEKEKDNPKEKEKDNPKEKEKDNPKEKEKDNPKEKEKDNPKEKEKDNPKEKEQDNPKEKEKDNPKEKEKDNPKEKEKDNPKEKEKDNPKEKEKDNPKEKEKEKDNPKEKEKEKDNPKEKEKDNPKEKEKEKDNPKEKEKEKDNPKEKEKDNPKEKEKDNPKEKEKEKDNLKEKDNPKEKEKDNPKEKEKEKQESCAGLTKIKTCAVKDVVVACIKSFSSGSKEVVILVQNVGNSTLKATLSANGISKHLEIHKHQNGKVNISIDPGKSTNITLNAGTGECKLHIDPPPRAFPSLKTIATPINGAYFLIVAVLTFGGMWACCLIRKRKERTGGGVPYQELEMGLPESVPATAMETAEGWDEGWDDDWDGENAVKTPGAHLGSISVNGLTSRAANKDGWND